MSFLHMESLSESDFIYCMMSVFSVTYINCKKKKKRRGRKKKKWGEERRGGGEKGGKGGEVEGKGRRGEGGERRLTSSF